MSYENGTTHYNLPQTIGTDKRDWFDTNEAFANVDADLYTAKTTADDGATAIAGIRATMATMQATQVTFQNSLNELSAVQTTQGNAITSLSGKVDDDKQDLSDAMCSITEPTATALYAHSIGEYFWYNDTLYITTADIAIGNQIVPNTNCDTVTLATEIQGVKPGSNGSVSVDSTGKTIGQVLNQIFSGLDLTKIVLGRSRLEINGIRNYIITQSTANVVSFMSFAATDTFIYGYIAQNSSVCIYYTFSNSTATDKTNESAGTNTYTFYY